MNDNSNHQVTKRSAFERAYDFIFYFYDEVRKDILTAWDDVQFSLARALSPLGGRAIMSLTNFFTFTLERSDRQGFLLRLIKIVLGVAVAIPLYLVLLALLLVAGAIASVFGLRNLGEYSFKEEVLALGPLVLLLGTAPLWLSDYSLGKLSLILCYSLLLVGFDFLFGQCGILSFGHAAFAYLGSYFAAFLCNGNFGWKFPFFIAAFVASLAVAAIGFLIGLPSLRVKDQYLLVVTLAVALSISLVFHSRYVSQYSGMAVGGLSIDQPQFFNLITNASGSVQNYLFVFLSTIVLIFIAHNIIRRSQIGRAFHVIKCDNEVSMIFGVSVLRYKTLAFALSAFYAAYAGCLLMLLNKFIGIDSYPVSDIMDYYVALTIGGIGTILGAVLGGAFLAFEVDITSAFGQLIPKGQHLARVFYGVLLIATVYFGPRGLAGLIGSFAAKYFKAGVRRGSHYMFPPPDYNAAENRSSPIKER